MDKTRTLPPLVYGKTTGVLDFCVDEVRIFRNILVLTENCDIVAQVQWWGEVLPAYLRPKQLHLPKMFKKCEILNSYCHGTTYEIKTTLDLFKSYLETCEMLEVEVYEAIETCLIGSAFLKDLIYLVFKNNEPVEIPLIGYLGEEVGKIKVHVRFSAKCAPISNKKPNIGKGKFFPQETVENKKKFERSQAIKTNSLLANEKIVYASHESKKLKSFKALEETPKNYQDKTIFNKGKKYNFCDEPEQKLPESHKQCKTVFEETVGSRSKARSKNVSLKCFPEVKISDDASKVLYFQLGAQKLNTTNTFLKKEKLFPKGAKEPFKKNAKLGPCKTNNDNLNIDEKNPVCQSIKEPKMENQNFAELPNFLNDDFPLFRSELSANDETFSKVFNTGKKAVDYLLGVKLSKEDEESALNDFREMSPCQDFVSSISQLFTVSNNSLEKLGDEYSLPTTDYVRVNNLNFDLSNAIERNYLKTFFMKPKDVQNDFEIAELLNKDKNYSALEEWESKDKTESFKQRGVEKYEEKLPVQKENDWCVNTEKDYFPNNVGAMTNYCSQCKYNEKLGELDVIIESLKHFEKNMSLQDKVAHE